MSHRSRTAASRNDDANRRAGSPRGQIRAAEAAAAPPRSPDPALQRQLMLLTLERKFRSLMRSAQELTHRLSDPNEPREEIEASLGQNGIERQAILAEHAVVQAGQPFAFPSAEELERLRAAMADLETGIARTAATQEVILATAAVVQAFRQSA